MRLKVSNIKKKVNNEGPSFKEGVNSYFKGVKAEWNRIVWPERRQVFVETLVVVVIVFFFTTMVYVMDVLFRGLLGLISKQVG